MTTARRMDKSVLGKLKKRFGTIPDKRIQRTKFFNWMVFETPVGFHLVVDIISANVIKSRATCVS